MSKELTQQHWSEIVIAAYRSGEKIRHWCQKHGINEKGFHGWAKKLGYTENGKRTDKYYSLMEDPTTEIPEVAMAVPVFVEVPSQVLENFREPVQVFPSDHPLITVQAGSYQIGIRDGFSEQTLSKVLEVIRYA